MISDLYKDPTTCKKCGKWKVPKGASIVDTWDKYCKCKNDKN